MVEPFRDLLAELVRVDAHYLVVGAHALGVHGVPRATVDLDVWIDRDPSNVRRVWRALAAFGAPLGDLGVTEADFGRPDVVVQFGLPPYRIDIMTSVSGVEFAEAWGERIDAPFGDLQVHYLGLGAFVRNKRASGRLKDLADLEALGELPPES